LGNLGNRPAKVLFGVRLASQAFAFSGFPMMPDILGHSRLHHSFRLDMDIAAFLLVQGIQDNIYENG
jgi:hypothetical protein